MIPIIRDLLAAEKEAERIIGDARERVEQERSELEAEEQAHLQEARKFADARVSEETAQARSEGQAKYEAAREQARAAVTEFLAENDEEIESVVREIAEYVCRPEMD